MCRGMVDSTHGSASSPASSPASPTVPSVYLDGSKLPPGERLAAFAQLAAGYTSEKISDGDFEIDARGWLLGELMVTSSRLTALRIERTHAHITRDKRDTYSIVVLRRGSWTAHLDTGQHVHVAAGQVCVIDFAQPWVIEGAAQDNIMLVVPRPLAAELAPGAPPLHGRLIEGAPGRLLAEHMFALARHLPDLKMSDLPMVQKATIGALTATLQALPQEDANPCRNLPADTGSRVLVYIEQHLTDSRLSIATICRDVSISRASLYRSFNTPNGIATYIQQRRLEAAHALISDEGGKLSMAGIAHQYGFRTQAHFSTAFRRMFGYTPVAARNVRLNARDVGDVFEGWQRIIAGLPEDGNKTA